MILHQLARHDIRCDRARIDFTDEAMADGLRPEWFGDLTKIVGKTTGFGITWHGKTDSLLFSRSDLIGAIQYQQ